MRIDLRRVPPIRIRRQDLETDLQAEDADVSINHGDDTVELIPGIYGWPKNYNYFSGDRRILVSVAVSQEYRVPEEIRVLG